MALLVFKSSIDSNGPLNRTNKKERRVLCLTRLAGNSNPNSNPISSCSDGNRMIKTWLANIYNVVKNWGGKWGMTKYLLYHFFFSFFNHSYEFWIIFASSMFLLKYPPIFFQYFRYIRIYRYFNPCTQHSNCLIKNSLQI